jgi:tetratricopeptide (TPR) repeat protein
LAIARASETRDPDTEADALVWLSLVRLARTGGRDPAALQDAISLQSQALAIGLSHHDPNSRRIAETRRALGTTLFRVGRNDEAIEHLRGAVAGFGAGNDISVRAALAELTELCLETLRPEEAEESARHLLRLQDATPDIGVRERIMAFYRLGRALLAAGRRDEAGDEFERACDLARSIVPPPARLVAELENWRAMARNSPTRS